MMIPQWGCALARTFDQPAASLGFCRDTRPLDDQLRAIAELGALAPEALLLSEIRILCGGYLAAAPKTIASIPEQEPHDELIAV